MSDRIHVAIRVRPLNSREQQYAEAWQFDDKTITPLSLDTGRPIGYSYSFDQIYGKNENSKDIYDKSASDVVRSAMEGINGTIFAYGQTSSGKTFTMKGNHQYPGIIPLAIQDIFKYIENNPSREFLLRVSYMEIYNEVITDLLVPENTNLPIHEHIEKGVFVGKLKEEIVTSPEQVLQIMAAGEVHRHVGSTNMNEHSSRSHTIFRMVIESRERESGNQESSATVAAKPAGRGSLQGGAVKVSLLNLVDLAGSERANLTGAEGQRLKEGGHINKSLLTLERVIAKLSEGQAQHVPYRDSKLTRILQPALGGNARTTIVCTITPASCFSEESLTTLKFANSAKNIRTKPKVNEVLDDKALLKRYQKQIAQMEQELEKYRTQQQQQQEPEQPPVPDQQALAAPVAVSSGLSVLSPLQINPERMQHRQELLDRLTGGIINAKKLKKSRADGSSDSFASRKDRRQTWCPPSGRYFAASQLDGSFVASDEFDVETMEDEDSLEELLLHPQLDLGEVASTASSSANTSNIVEELKSRVSQLEAELAAARAEVNTVSTPAVIIEDSSEKTNELEMLLRSAQEEKAVLATKLSELETESSTLQQTNETLRTELEHALARPAETVVDSDELEQLKERISDLEEQLKTETEIHEEFQTQLIEEHSKREQELEEQVESMAAQVAQLRAYAETSERTYAAKENALKEHFELARASLEAAHSKNKLADEEIAKLRAQVSEFEKKLEASSESFEQHQLELQKAKWDIDIRDGEYKELEQKYSALVAKVTELESSSPAPAQVDTSAITAEYEAKIARVQQDSNKAIDVWVDKFAKIEGELRATRAEHEGQLQRQRESLEAEHRAETEQITADIEAMKVLIEDLENQRASSTQKPQASATGDIAARLLASENECETLRSQLNAAHKENEEVKSAHASLAADLHALQAEIEAFAIEEKRSEAVRNAQESVDSDHIRVVESLKAQIRAEHDSFQAQVADYHSNLASMETQIKTLKESNAQLQADLNLSRTKEESAKQEADEIRQKLKALESDAAASNSSLSRSDTDIQQMRKKVSQLQAQADLYSQSNAKLEKQLKEVEDEKKRLDGKLYHAQRELEELQAAKVKSDSSSKSSASVSALESHIQDLKRKFTAEKDELEREIARMRPLASSASALDADLRDLTRQLEKLKAEKKDLQSDASEVVGKLKRLQQSYEDLESKYSIAQMKLQNHEMALQSAEEAEQKLRSELKRLREDADSRESCIRRDRLALQETVEQNEMVVKQLRAENEKLDRELTEYSTQMDSWRAHAEQLQAQLRTLELSRAESGAELSSLQTENGNLQRDLKLLRQRYDDETSKLRSEIAQIKKDTKAASTQKAAWEKDKIQYMKEYDKMQEKVDKAENKAKQVAAEKSSLLQEKAQQERDLVALRAGTETLKKQVDKAEKSQKAAEARCVEVEKQMQAIEKELGNVGKNYERAMAQLETSQAESSRYKVDLEAVRENADKLRQQLTSIRAELANLQISFDEEREAHANAVNETSAVRSELASTLSSLQDCEVRLEATTLAVQQRDAAIEQLQEQQRQLVAERDDIVLKANETITQLNEALGNAQTERDQLAAKYQQLEQEHVQLVNQANATITQLSQQYEDLKNAKEFEITDIKQQLDAVSAEKQQIEAARDQLVAEASATLAQLNEQLENLAREKLTQEQQIQKLSDDLVEQAYKEEEAKAAFEQQNEAAQADISALKHQLEGKLAEIAEANERIHAMNAELENFKVEVAQALDAASQQEQELSGRLSSREQEIAELKEKFEFELSTTQEQLATTQKSLNVSISELCAQLSEKQEQVAKAEAEAAELTLALEQERASTATKMFEMEQLVEEATSEITATKQRAAAKEQDLTARLQQASQHAASVESELTQTQEKLSKVVGNLQHLENSMREKQNHIVSLETTVRDREDEVSRLRDQLQQLNSVQENLKSSASTQVSNLTQLLEKATSDRAQIEKKLSDAIAEAANLRNQLESAVKELEETKEVAEFHRREADEFQQLIGQQDERMADYEKLKADLEKMAASHRTELEQTKGKYKNYIKTLEKKSAEQIQAYKDRLKETTDQVSNYRQRLERKHGEVDQLNADIKTLQSDIQRLRAPKQVLGSATAPRAVLDLNKENM